MYKLNKLNKLNMVASIALATYAITLTGCGQEKISQEVVDRNQTISQVNAEKNATSFAKQRFPEYERVLVDSDSTINADCRYGDGWASGTIQMPNSKISIKCQTNGRGKGYQGCLTKVDFMKKSYAKEEGTCNNKLTSLPKFK